MSDLNNFDHPIHELVELPWVKCFPMFLHPIEREDLIKSDIDFSIKMPGFVRSHWHIFGELTLLDPWRAGVLLDLLVETISIPGDIVECGTYRGGTAIMMGLALQHLGSKKKIHGFDSFAGLPAPDRVKDQGYKEGQFHSDLDSLRALLKELDLDEKITLYPGWFSDTVSPFLKSTDREISFLHIDCDLYASTNDCFPMLYDVVEAGGAVVLDDFNDGAKGEKRAVHECLENLHRAEEIVMGPAPQAYFTKRSPAPTEQGLEYNVTDLQGRQHYLSWISAHLEADYGLQLEQFQK